MCKCLAVLLLLGSVASAQERAEVYGHVGTASNWDDEGSIGRGVTFGGSIDWRVLPRLALELDIDHFQNKRDFSFISVKGSGTFVTGNVLFHFTTGKVQPYVLAGGGVLNYKLEQGFAPGVSASATSGALNFGFGVKGMLPGGWIVRPEIRAAASSSIKSIEPPLLHGRISVAIGYRW